MVRQEIVALRKLRTPVARIAQKFGCSTSPVYRVLYEEGLVRPRARLSGEQERELIEDYKSGVAIKDIERRYGVSRTKIYSLLDKYDAPRRGRFAASKLSATDRKHISFLLVSGLFTQTALARLYGVHRATIHEIAEETWRSLARGLNLSYDEVKQKARADRPAFFEAAVEAGLIADIPLSRIHFRVFGGGDQEKADDSV